MEVIKCNNCSDQMKVYKISSSITAYYCGSFCSKGSLRFSYCDHESFLICRHETTVQKQCKNCGELFGPKIKKDSVDFKNLPDSSILKLKHKTETSTGKQLAFIQRFNERCEEVRNNYKDAFFKAYKKYLNSEQWKSKRELVLKRDNYLCQSCLINKANQVHHLTYELVGKEPAFHLTSVCKECHGLIDLKERSQIYQGYDNFIDWANSKY